MVRLIIVISLVFGVSAAAAQSIQDLFRGMQRVIEGLEQGATPGGDTKPPASTGARQDQNLSRCVAYFPANLQVRAGMGLFYLNDTSSIPEFISERWRNSEDELYQVSWEEVGLPHGNRQSMRDDAFMFNVVAFSINSSEFRWDFFPQKASRRGLSSVAFMFGDPVPFTPPREGIGFVIPNDSHLRDFFTDPGNVARFCQVLESKISTFRNEENERERVRRDTASAERLAARERERAAASGACQYGVYHDRPLEYPAVMVRRSGEFENADIRFVEEAAKKNGFRAWFRSDSGNIIAYGERIDSGAIEQRRGAPPTLVITEADCPMFIKSLREGLQLQAAARGRVVSYRERQKSLLERIFNYSQLANEDGADVAFWVSGDDGRHKCILSQYLFERKSLEIDIRQLSQTGFRISQSQARNLLGQSVPVWRFGDEKVSFQADENGQVLERLQRAWGLAFQECPGRRSEF